MIISIFITRALLRWFEQLLLSYKVGKYRSINVFKLVRIFDFHLREIESSITTTKTKTIKSLNTCIIKNKVKLTCMQTL